MNSSVTSSDHVRSSHMLIRGPKVNCQHEYSTKSINASCDLEDLNNVTVFGSNWPRVKYDSECVLTNHIEAQSRYTRASVHFMIESVKHISSNTNRGLAVHTVEGSSIHEMSYCFDMGISDVGGLVSMKHISIASVVMCKTPIRLPGISMVAVVPLSVYYGISQCGKLHLMQIYIERLISEQWVVAFPSDLRYRNGSMRNLTLPTDRRLVLLPKYSHANCSIVYVIAGDSNYYEWPRVQLYDLEGMLRYYSLCVRTYIGKSNECVCCKEHNSS
jgi:hypothetical protein